MHAYREKNLCLRCLLNPTLHFNQNPMWNWYISIHLTSSLWFTFQRNEIDQKKWKIRHLCTVWITDFNSKWINLSIFGRQIINAFHFNYILFSQNYTIYALIVSLANLSKAIKCSGFKTYFDWKGYGYVPKMWIICYSWPK